MYRETLPASCPPAKAIIPNSLTVFRLVKGEALAMDDFASNNLLGHPLPPTCDPCCHSSCSVFDNVESVEKIRKFPKLKHYKSIASLSLTPNTGMVLKGNNGHYDWWIFATCNPLTLAALI